MYAEESLFIISWWKIEIYVIGKLLFIYLSLENWVIEAVVSFKVKKYKILIAVFKRDKIVFIVRMQ